MTAQLTLEQRAALASARDRLELEDPDSRRMYVLIPLAEYKRLSAASLDSRENYAAIERVFSDGWNDPPMDDYDTYEEHRG